MGKSELRGFSVFEHGCFLSYDINLDQENSYYDSFKNSDIEGSVSRFETDENGFIVPSEIYEEADFNIFFLGDSTVECSFVQPKKRIPYLAGRILEKLLKCRVNAYNAGVSGADTLSLIKVLLMKIFPMEPDMVVMCNTDRELVYLLSQKPNDKRHMRGASNGKKDIIIYRDWLAKASLKRRVFTCAKLIFRGKHLIDEKEYNKTQSLLRSNVEKKRVDPEKILDIFKKDLMAVVALCEARHIPLILMTQANQYILTKENKRLEKLYYARTYVETNMKYADYCRMYTKANEIIRTVGKEKHIYVIDLENFAKNKSLLYDSVYYTNRGAEVVSEYIGNKVYDKMIEEETEKEI